MNKAIITSALAQAAFGVALGWPLSLTRLETKLLSAMGQKRLLQCHLDNLFMAALKLGVAVAVPDIPRPIGLALLIGSWVNPQLFLLQMFGAEDKKKLSVIAVPSFIAVTYAWFGLARHWMKNN